MGGVSLPDVNGIAKTVKIFPAYGIGPGRFRLMIEDSAVYIQDWRVSPETEAVLGIVKPDEIICSGKPCFFCQGRFKAQAAESADIVLKCVLLILLFFHRFKKHQAGIGQPSAMKSVNSALCHDFAGAGKIVRATDGSGQFFHIGSLNHGIIINNQKPVAGGFHDLFYSNSESPCTAQIFFHMEDFQAVLMSGHMIQVFS